MSCYTPKRKTNNGIEDVKLPINSIKGLEDRLATIGGRKLSMPIIRLANVLDTNNTMIIGPSNPLKFCVEIIDGSLQVGDSLQICVKQLVTYRKRNKRKYRLRCQWSVKVTEQDMACELTNRICYTMELDEKYASVILRRYVDNGGDHEGVYCIRNGEKINYLDVVKEVEKKSDNSFANDLI